MTIPRRCRRLRDRLTPGQFRRREARLSRRLNTPAPPAILVEASMRSWLRSFLPEYRRRQEGL